MLLFAKVGKFPQLPHKARSKTPLVFSHPWVCFQMVELPMSAKMRPNILWFRRSTSNDKDICVFSLFVSKSYDFFSESLIYSFSLYRVASSFRILRQSKRELPFFVRSTSSQSACLMVDINLDRMIQNKASPTICFPAVISDRFDNDVFHVVHSRGGAASALMNLRTLRTIVPPSWHGMPPPPGQGGLPGWPAVGPAAPPQGPLPTTLVHSPISLLPGGSVAKQSTEKQETPLKSQRLCRKLIWNQNRNENENENEIILKII